jgi:hypothetical protein
VISILEGGYNPPVLAECVEKHLREILDNSGSATGPAMPSPT